MDEVAADMDGDHGAVDVLDLEAGRGAARCGAACRGAGGIAGRFRGGLRAIAGVGSVVDVDWFDCRVVVEDAALTAAAESVRVGGPVQWKIPGMFLAGAVGEVSIR